MKFRSKASFGILATVLAVALILFCVAAAGAAEVKKAAPAKKKADELSRPLSDGRMTDEEWRSIVYDPKKADELKKFLPAWYEKAGQE